MQTTTLLICYLQLYYHTTIRPYYYALYRRRCAAEARDLLYSGLLYRGIRSYYRILYCTIYTVGVVRPEHVIVVEGPRARRATCVCGDGGGEGVEYGGGVTVQNNPSYYYAGRAATQHQTAVQKRYSNTTLLL